MLNKNMPQTQTLKKFVFSKKGNTVTVKMKFEKNYIIGFQLPINIPKDYLYKGEIRIQGYCGSILADEIVIKGNDFRTWGRNGYYRIHFDSPNIPPNEYKEINIKVEVLEGDENLNKYDDKMFVYIAVDLLSP